MLNENPSGDEQGVGNRRVRCASALIAVGLAGCGARTGLLDTSDAGSPPPLDDRDVDVNVSREGCEGGVPRILVVSREGVLLHFDPDTASFEVLGRPNCPAEGTFFSMAISRQRVAYLGVDGVDKNTIFRVDTRTLACSKTAFTQDQPFPPYGLNGQVFGMAFVTDGGGPAERLHIAVGLNSTPRMLATLDIETFELNPIGQLNAPVGGTELTGTGDGRLYGFAVRDPAMSLLDLDKQRARILGEQSLPDLSATSFAFAYWNRGFYFFTHRGDAGGSTASRLELGSTVLEAVAKTSEVVVGAAVSTCAPIDPR